jgi:hypothetical protein
MSGRPAAVLTMKAKASVAELPLDLACASL